MNVFNKLFGKRYTKEEALKLVQQNGYNLKILSVVFRNDPDIVLAAFMKNTLSLQYAGDNLKNDKDFILGLINDYGVAFQHIGKTLLNDKDIVLAKVIQYGEALEYASDELKNDKEVVLSAIKQTRYALGYVNESLRQDPVVQFLLKNRDMILEHDWQVVKRALLESPDYFLNPEPYMQVLTADMENPYLMLAQYALNKDTEITPVDYLDVRF